ncbi:hypothetical protein GCM10027256_37250 [Novispirillum itersonii subsp. nipponicum]
MPTLSLRLLHILPVSLATCLAASSALAAGSGPQPAPAKPVVQTDSDRGWYFQGKGGPSFTALGGVAATGGGSPTESDAANVVGAFGMAAGYEWAHRYRIPLRTELEFMNRTDMAYNASPVLAGQPGALASSVQNVTVMAKGYWYFPVGSTMWWPFVSGGVGLSRNTVKSEFTPTGGTMVKNTHATDSLAWSAGVGASFKLGPQVMNDIELRYVDLGKADWGMPASRNLLSDGFGGFSATELVFSLRYMF